MSSLFSIQCELTKGTVPKVFIRTTDKSEAKVSAQGDPAKLVRNALVCLFGRETLEKHAVTALGQKPGTLGIRKHVRDAIRGK